MAHAVEKIVQGRQIQRNTLESRQAVIAQAKGNGTVLAIHDPRVPGEAQVQKRRTYGSDTEIDGRTNRLSAGRMRMGERARRRLEHAVHLPDRGLSGFRIHEALRSPKLLKMNKANRMPIGVARNP
jgi:hypothetical protein